MKIEIIGNINNIETIARGSSVKNRSLLNKMYGRHNWSKKKGMARVRKPNGDVVFAEIHWFEAHGLGRKDVKIKFEIGE